MLGSLAARFRTNRARHLVSLIDRLDSPLRILDLGGTEAYWQQIGLAARLEADITLLNLTREQTRAPRFSSIAGDACDLSRFGDQSFDLVFSNSVIEHVGGIDRQRQMAAEITRVGRHCYVQTPNRGFPIEPHFLLPLFQFYPAWLQQTALMYAGMSVEQGRLVRRRPGSREEAARLAASIRLMTRRELQALFPGASIWEERLGPFVKSFVAISGWPS